MLHNSHYLDADGNYGSAYDRADKSCGDSFGVAVFRENTAHSGDKHCGVVILDEGLVGGDILRILCHTQTITLCHEAHTRALFAEGALDAAKFLCAQAPGLYNMQSMIN